MNTELPSNCLALWIPKWYELDAPLKLGERQLLWLRPTEFPDAMSSRSDKHSDPSAPADVETDPSSESPTPASGTFLICDELWQSTGQTDPASDHPANSPRKCLALVSAISHHQLGEFVEVQTDGLDYRFTQIDGHEIRVNAEEQPGRAYDFPTPPNDWNLLVELTSIQWQ